VSDRARVAAAGGPTGDDLFDALDEATQGALVREVPGAVGRYAFAHALVRSALYEELTTNRRVRMHWRVGEVIEARYSSDLDAHLDELAYHLGEGALAGDPTKAVDYARRAGARAMEDLAFESAAPHFERALGSLELVDHADPGERCDLQLAWADALNHAGDPRRREVAFAAAAAARAIGDADRLGRAALVLVSTTTAASEAGLVDEALVGLLEDALAAVGPDPSVARAQLLASVSVELQFSSQADRRMTLAREALDVARETRDPDALGYVLTRSWTLIECSRPWHVEFGALIEEAEVVARDAGDTDALRAAKNFSLFIAAMVGDRAAVDARLAAYVRVCDQVRTPQARVSRIWTEGTLAAFEGRFAEAERLALEGVELARSADISESSYSGMVGGQLYTIRLSQGRADELVPILEGLVDSQPGAPVWRVALAGALVESDRVEDARPHFMWLAEDDFATSPRDVLYPVTLCGLARMTYVLAPPEPFVRSVYDALLPFRGIFNWSGPTLSDASDAGLAMASAALGRHDDADAHFADAIALCERAGARAYLARYHFDWSRVLSGRGDRSAAREHAEIAVTLGEELGMDGPFGVVPRARTLLASL
jgi:tetratricopeptide (TPR) repeat protein